MIYEGAFKQLNEDETFKGYIYKCTNKINGKFYIGQTKHAVDSRFKQHVWASMHDNNTSIAFHNALRKNGKDNFIIEIIDVATSAEELNEKERYWIAKLHAQDPAIGYNLAKGGEGGAGGPMFAGHKHSAETRAQMSVSRRGENNANYGNHRIMSDEEKPRHASPGESNGMYGKTHSEESKLKNRNSHINKTAFSNKTLNQVKMLTPEEGEKLIQQDPSWFKGNIHARMYKEID